MYRVYLVMGEKGSRRFVEVTQRLVDCDTAEQIERAVDNAVRCLGRQERAYLARTGEKQ